MLCADIKATFGNRRHELNVSTYHMCILMLFNQSDSLSYRDMEQATGIPPADLTRALQSLALVKVSELLFNCRNICQSPIWHH